MTTKEQERKALEKIRSIVAELGENSYIGTAFDGAFSLAEQNIEYDAAFTTQYHIDAANEVASKIKGFETELDRMEKRYKGVENEHKRVEEMLERERNEYAGLEKKTSELEAALHVSAYEVIQLKARLYDLVCK